MLYYCRPFTTLCVETMSSKEIQYRHHTTEQVFRLLDLIAICVSLFLALSLYPTVFTEIYLIILCFSLLSFMFAAEMTNLYHAQRGQAIKKHIGNILSAWLITFLMLLFLGYISKTSHDVSRIVLILWLLITPIQLYAWRFAFSLIQAQYFSDIKHFHKVAIIGANETGANIAEYIDKNPESGLLFIGFFDDRYGKKDRIKADYAHRIIGYFNDAVQQSQENKIDVIYITLPMSAEKRIAKLIEQLGNTTTAVHVIPDFFMYNLLRARWHSIGDYNALSIYDTPFYGAGSVVKKLEDIVLASFIIILISVPMIMIALAIKLTSPGPILFKQKRYGINGKEVSVLKFRSMTVCENTAIIKQASKNDVRITKLGAFLRKTSLDELPQFFNVIDGSMSIVGPRPHAVAHNELYRKEIDGYMLRHMVKPGITGWAQINGYRGETKDIKLMKKRIEYDLNYIRNWSLYWDLKIIVLTIFKGFINKNAY